MFKGKLFRGIARNTLTTILTVALVIPATVFADDITEPTETVTSEEHHESNESSVSSNEGSIDTNNGSIENNSGTVTENGPAPAESSLPNPAFNAVTPGAVTADTADATITVNTGVVTENNAWIGTNAATGTVVDNNGTVVTNNGSVGVPEVPATAPTEENSEGTAAIPATGGNDGTIGVNTGTVEENAGVIITNDGTAAVAPTEGNPEGTPQKKGKVKKNTGVVVTNTENGEVTSNEGAVETNNGNIDSNTGTSDERINAIETNRKPVYDEDGSYHPPGVRPEPNEQSNNVWDPVTESYIEITGEFHNGVFIDGEITPKNGVGTNNGTINTNEGTVRKNNSTGVINDNEGDVIDNDGTVTLNGQEGYIDHNGLLVVTNQGNVDINTSTGTISLNEGDVTINTGTIGNTEDATQEANTGNVSYNEGLITNSTGTVYENTGTGTITNNTGTVTHNFGDIQGGGTEGTIENNYGDATTGGNTVTKQWWEVWANAGEDGTGNVVSNFFKSTIGGIAGSFLRKDASVCDQIEVDYVESTKQLTITPDEGNVVLGLAAVDKSGNAITLNSAFDPESKVWTIAGVSQNINLQYTTAPIATTGVTATLTDGKVMLSDELELQVDGKIAGGSCFHNSENYLINYEDPENPGTYIALTKSVYGVLDETNNNYVADERYVLPDAGDYKWKFNGIVNNALQFSLSANTVDDLRPDNPNNPNNPTDPSNPDNPSDSSDPDNPSNPDNPTNPDNPVNPDNPDNPSNPDNPGNGEGEGNEVNPDDSTPNVDPKPVTPKKDTEKDKKDDVSDDYIEPGATRGFSPVITTQPTPTISALTPPMRGITSSGTSFEIPAVTTPKKYIRNVRTMTKTQKQASIDEVGYGTLMVTTGNDYESVEIKQASETQFADQQKTAESVLGTGFHVEHCFTFAKPAGAVGNAAWGTSEQEIMLRIPNLKPGAIVYLIFTDLKGSVQLIPCTIEVNDTIIEKIKGIGDGGFISVVMKN